MNFYIIETWSDFKHKTREAPLESKADVGAGFGPDKRHFSSCLSWK